jgi:hypothetical protein
MVAMVIHMIGYEFRAASGADEDVMSSRDACAAALASDPGVVDPTGRPWDIAGWALLRKVEEYVSHHASVVHLYERRQAWRGSESAT